MGRKREFDEGGQHQVQTLNLRLLTGDVRLFVLPADLEDNEQHVDRLVCVHVFADGAESASAPEATVTHHKSGRVFRWEMCAVCCAMHTLSHRPDLLAEQDFRGALVRIMDEPDATA